jgi:hypothetical protein
MAVAVDFAEGVVSTVVEVAFVEGAVSIAAAVFAVTQVCVAEQLTAVHLVQDQAWLIVVLYGVG